MIKALFLLPLFFTMSVSSLAGIFGQDDRIESYLEGSASEIELARSTPAFFRTSMMKKLSNGDYVTKGWSTNFCPGVRFRGQPQVANCSASLIAPDIVLTAAHCIDEQMGLACDDFKIVFDYAMGEEISTLAGEKVYDCKEVLYYNFDLTLRSHDIAIVRLDRKVTDREPIELALRKPVKGEALSLIGYPLGMPQKIAANGEVLSVDVANVSFDNNLDTFSCNSGGPILDSEGLQIGVLVRGTGTNTSIDSERNCEYWTQSEDGYDFVQGNSLFHLKDELRSILR